MKATAAARWQPHALQWFTFIPLIASTTAYPGAAINTSAVFKGNLLHSDAKVVA